MCAFGLPLLIAALSVYVTIRDRMDPHPHGPRPMFEAWQPGEMGYGYRPNPIVWDESGAKLAFDTELNILVLFLAPDPMGDCYGDPRPDGYFDHATFFSGTPNSFIVTRRLDRIYVFVPSRGVQDFDLAFGDAQATSKIAVAKYRDIADTVLQNYHGNDGAALQAHIADARVVSR